MKRPFKIYEARTLVEEHKRRLIKLNNELDDKTFKDIIQEEIDRIRLKNRIEA